MKVFHKINNNDKPMFSKSDFRIYCYNNDKSKYSNSYLNSDILIDINNILMSSFVKIAYLPKEIQLVLYKKRDDYANFINTLNSIVNESVHTTVKRTRGEKVLKRKKYFK